MKKSLIRKKKIFSYVSVFFICLIMVVAAVARCAFLIEGSYVEQLERNLADVAGQNAEALKSEISIRYDLLKSIACRFELEPDRRLENLYLFEPVSDSFHLKRIGFCDPDGTAHGTSGVDTNLKNREFFCKGMMGFPWISDILMDAMDENHEYVTVMSMPLFDNQGKVNGVAAITYSTEILSKELSRHSFEGNGNSIVFNNRGEVNITSNPQFINVADNIFNRLWDDMGNNFSSKYEMLNYLFRSEEKGQTTDKKIKVDGIEYYYHIMPVSFFDDSIEWYVLSTVPAVYLTQRFAYSRKHLYKMVIIVLAFGITSIIFLNVLKSRQRRNTYKLAYCSPVTGGANTDLFKQIVGANCYTGFIVYMNIDNFPYTSLAIGKKRSELLIQSIWKKLSWEEKIDEFFAHHANDAFYLYFDYTDKGKLEQRLLELRNIIHEAAMTEQISWISARFGVCRYGEGINIEECCRKSEIAVQGALQNITGIDYFDEERQKKQIESQDLEDKFKDALSREEFQIYFQPKYKTDTKIICGAEALVRWVKEDGTVVRPDQFIPLLERNGDITLLDEYIMEKVCSYQAQWLKEKRAVVPVSVNISKATLYSSKVVERYMEIIQKEDLPPYLIQLEVTETLATAGENISQLLNRFRRMGIRILMDDFGTGYTALSTLNLRCFDVLKVDKSLVDGMGTDYGRQLLENVIEMTKKLGYEITVEGVETEEQYESLKDTGCDNIQGFLFAKPMSSKEYSALQVIEPVGN